MIIYFPVAIKQLSILGKNYPFPRPAVCPCCKSNRLWSHGYVLRYLFYTQDVYLKRYRCVDCHSVHILKPKGILPYHQLFCLEIFRHLCLYVLNGCYDTANCSRQRQRHWFKSLHRNIRLYIGFSVDLLTGFERLLTMGLNPFRRPK